MFSFDKLKYSEYLSLVKLVTEKDNLEANFEKILDKYSTEKLNYDDMSLTDVVKAIVTFVEQFNEWLKTYMTDKEVSGTLDWTWKRYKQYRRKLENNESVLEFFDFEEKDPLASAVLEKMNEARLLIQKSFEAKN